MWLEAGSREQGVWSEVGRMRSREQGVWFEVGEWEMAAKLRMRSS